MSLSIEILWGTLVMIVVHFSFSAPEQESRFWNFLLILLYLLQGLELSSQKWYTCSYTHLPTCVKILIRSGKNTRIYSLVSLPGLKTRFAWELDNRWELDLLFLGEHINPYVPCLIQLLSADSMWIKSYMQKVRFSSAKSA